jgi:hypothetical protein
MRAAPAGKGRRAVEKEGAGEHPPLKLQRAPTQAKTCKPGSLAGIKDGGAELQGRRKPQAGRKDDALIQPAKNADGGSRFLQIVAKPHRAPRKAKPESKLTRVAFRVSRLMEFCSTRELQNQTGHSVSDWPLVVLKELTDNALDACEEAEVAPVISIAVKRDSITIQDNAGGISTNVIKSILDYSVRVSSREAYVSPTAEPRATLSRLFSPWATCSAARPRWRG